MQFDNTDMLRQRALNEASLPPAPPPAPQRSAWGAIPRGVAGAFAQLGADAASILRAAGTAGAIAAEGDAGLVGVLGQDAVRAGADEARKRLQEGTEWDSATARAARDWERTLRPDAATATTAENIVYGLSRGLTKGVGAVLVAGPAAGAAVFGGSEGAATFDDLRREGVDSGTAGKAAAVAGLTSAAGIALPMAGSTLSRTAALYLASGPGGFMAQQQGIRTILERADYTEQAAKFDPFDPVGLALSALVPLPFAGYGALRNIRASRQGSPDAPSGPLAADQAPGNTEVAPAAEDAPAATVPREAVDAAMVHNLTLLRQVMDEVPPDAADAQVRRILPADETPAPVVPVEPAPVEPPAAQPTMPPQIDAAMRAAEQLQASGKPLNEFVTGANLAPDVQNLLVGIAEAGQDAPRTARMLADFARSVEARPTDPAADLAADVVEAARKGQEVTPVRGQANQAATRAKDPAAQAMATRLADMETTQAQMVVRLDEGGIPVTLADELAAVRREAAEGTDAELGSLDADLVRVAAECALSTGQAM